MPPDDAIRPACAALLDRVLGRLRIEHASCAVAAGVFAALAARVPGQAHVNSLIVTIAALVAGAVVAALTWRRTACDRTRMAAAARVEGVCAARNVIITAEELERHPERAAWWLRARVVADADAVASRVRAGSVVAPSLTTAALGLALLGSAIHVAVSRSTSPQVALIKASGRESTADEVASVGVEVHPPGYSQLPVQRLRDPLRIDALEGSRVVFSGGSPGMRIRFGDNPIASDPRELVVRSSGYFVIENVGNGRTHLIPVAVQPDRRPVVRIDLPAKDLLLESGLRTVPVTIAASDDLGLSSLELRFTKVTGSGEQFEFVEGTLPLRTTQSSEREWRAAGNLALAPMRLEPGDSIVYRAVARDHRPGEAGMGSSETYFVEIAGPGQLAFESVEMPPELERYGLSQQMIVIKLEQLRAREHSLTRDDLVEQANSLAAEQRTVRASFVFLLGGHVEDEEQEAEQSHEIQEGRLENTARKDISAAVGQMTRAEQGMAAANPAAALPPARAAVESLQRAFGRSRYLLRALATRTRLDPARRLTGDTTSATDWHRTAAEARPGEAAALIEVLDRLLDLGSRTADGSSAQSGEVEALAEAALAVDPASAFWQRISARLQDIARRNVTSHVFEAHLSPLVTELHDEARRRSFSRNAAVGAATPLERAAQAAQRR